MRRNVLCVAQSKFRLVRTGSAAISVRVYTSCGANEVHSLFFLFAHVLFAR